MLQKNDCLSCRKITEIFPGGSAMITGGNFMRAHVGAWEILNLPLPAMMGRAIKAKRFCYGLRDAARKTGSIFKTILILRDMIQY